MARHEDVEALREALLRGLRVVLRPDQGDEAFERHLLLAARFHRAARLNAPDEGERAGWRQFFREHFPRGDEHALLLWEKWRNTLLKDEWPGSGVVVSHGQPDGHWRVFTPGGLYVNLESMWDNFEHAVGSMIRLLEADPDRRARTLETWAKRKWSVQLFPVPAPQFAVASAAGPSVTTPRLLPGR